MQRCYSLITPQHHLDGDNYGIERSDIYLTKGIFAGGVQGNAGNLGRQALYENGIPVNP